MDAVLTPPSQKRSQKQITPRLQRYAELRAQGLTQSAAALSAGYSAKQAGGKAERNPYVQRYLTEQRSSIRCAIVHTVSHAMDEAKFAMEFAYKTENANAYCKAVELRAKLSGLLIDRVEVFTADLKGALLAASKRVIEAAPGTYALMQVEQAAAQADPETTV